MHAAFWLSNNLVKGSHRTAILDHKENDHIRMEL